MKYVFIRLPAVCVLWGLSDGTAWTSHRSSPCVL